MGVLRQTWSFHCNFKKHDGDTLYFVYHGKVQNLNISKSYYLKFFTFKRYLDNVAVEMPQHQLLGSGEIFNLATKQCLDQSDKVVKMTI